MILFLFLDYHFHNNHSMFYVLSGHIRDVAFCSFVFMRRSFCFCFASCTCYDPHAVLWSQAWQLDSGQLKQRSGGLCTTKLTKSRDVNLMQPQKECPWDKFEVDFCELQPCMMQMMRNVGLKSSGLTAGR